MATPIRKVLISEFGDESKVNVVESQIQPPQQGEVQISVKYSGFGGSDINMRLGKYPMQKAAPLTPGYSCVGTVKVKGAGCTELAIGETVAALTVYDSEAELINIPEKYAIRVPKGVDPQAATALILDWGTAYGMIPQSVKITEGQKVFIHGVSGAVGFAAMKLAQLQGAHVYGTASEKNHAAIKEQGGTPFTYKNKDWMQFMESIGGADVILDPLGGESWNESWSILSKKGTLIGFGGNAATFSGDVQQSQLWGMVKLYSKNMCWSGRRAKFYYITRDDSTFKPNLNALFGLVGDGRVQVPIKKVWKMDDIQTAHRTWLGGMTCVGSILIKVS